MNVQAEALVEWVVPRPVDLKERQHFSTFVVKYHFNFTTYLEVLWALQVLAHQQAHHSLDHPFHRVLLQVLWRHQRPLVQLGLLPLPSRVDQRLLPLQSRLWSPGRLCHQLDPS